jgi:hypothetical protein
MVFVVGVGKSLDRGCKAGGGRGDLRVVQRDTTAQHYLAAYAVGAVADPRVVSEQVQRWVLEYPAPWLAVVQ